MNKPVITLAITEAGDVSMLYGGLDVDKAVEALHAARGTIDGEVLVIRKPLAYRRWKGKADAPVAKKTPKKFSSKE